MKLAPLPCPACGLPVVCVNADDGHRVLDANQPVYVLERCGGDGERAGNDGASVWARDRSGMVLAVHKCKQAMRDPDAARVRMVDHFDSIREKHHPSN